MAYKELGNIYLTWRKSRGDRRIIVGIIKKNATGVRFTYTITPQEAEKAGFVPYADFPSLEKEYTQNVLEVFALRLNKPERPDIQQYYDFWAIDAEHQQNKYYMLAHTQGLLATDNFEFLADFNPIKGLSFVSEICGLSHLQIPSNEVSIGDSLAWEREPLNKFDKYAVKVFKGELFVGYVKTVHNHIFSKNNSSRLKISVKSIESNGHLNRVFIKIFT